MRGCHTPETCLSTFSWTHILLCVRNKIERSQVYVREEGGRFAGVTLQKLGHHCDFSCLQSPSAPSAMRCCYLWCMERVTSSIGQPHTLTRLNFIFYEEPLATSTRRTRSSNFVKLKWIFMRSWTQFDCCLDGYGSHIMGRFVWTIVTKQLKQLWQNRG